MTDKNITKSFLLICSSSLLAHWVKPQAFVTSNLCTFVGGTSWPGNNQSQQWNRTIDATVVANFQKFGYIFSGQRLAVTGVSGQSESCCDPYRYENMFGSTFTGDWTWIYGSASASAHQPYEITLNTFTQSQTASNNLYLRHQTDGSVNSGPGFYTHTAGFYLYKAN